MVCTADARHVKPLLQHLIEENASKGWKDTLMRDKYDFKWFGATTEDTERKNLFGLPIHLVVEALKEKGRLANRFPGI